MMKMRMTLAASLLCGIAFFCLPSSGQAQGGSNGFAQVQFSSDSSRQEQVIIRQLYADFLSKQPNTEVASSVVDLDGDNVGEILMRFTSPETCTGDRCHTVVLQYSKIVGWTPIMERRSKSFEVERAAPTAMRNNGYRLIRTNGFEAWMYAPSGVYVATPSRAMGDFVTFDKPLDEGLYKDLPMAMAYPKASSYMALGNVLRGTMVLDGDCDGIGCRLVIAAAPRKTDKQRVVLDTIVAGGLVMIGKSTTQGVPDIITASWGGLDTWKWNGTAYAKAATTYPSDITPAP